MEPLTEAKALYEALKNVSELPAISFSLSQEKPGILDSKIGGSYYVPVGQEIPTDPETAKPLFLLAQINFSQLPHLESFPVDGLLQFFISGDSDLYGCNFDDPTLQEKWAIRYLENLPEAVSKNQIITPSGTEEFCLPFPEETEYKLIGTLTSQVITTGDYRFETIPHPDLPGNAASFFDLDDDIMDELEEMLQPFPCQIGGYAYFTQSDPREWMDEEEIPEILLFQLDSVGDIMWGDSGIANFFIKEDDLKNKDFSKVFYNWDCC